MDDTLFLRGYFLLPVKESVIELLTVVIEDLVSVLDLGLLALAFLFCTFCWILERSRLRGCSLLSSSVSFSN